MSDSKRFVIAIGSDDAGDEYQKILCEMLKNDSRVNFVVELSEPSENLNYPSVAFAVADLIQNHKADRGILICGTGLGMAISANKVAGIRAVTAHDSYSVERSILSNDAQILCLGQRVIGVELAKRLVNEWLNYKFDHGSKSAEKIAEITEYEQKK
jgi:ribose 5-phosphate isomerase B